MLKHAPKTSKQLAGSGHDDELTINEKFCPLDGQNGFLKAATLFQ